MVATTEAHRDSAGRGGRAPVGKQRRRRYALTGPEAERAASEGLVDAEWFRSEVPRKRLKELMRRSDHPAIRDTVIWLGGMALCAALACFFWAGWLAAPFMLVYGLLYGSGAEARRHETSHGAAFRTRWMSEVVFQISSFCTMREPTLWRWQHTRHHTDTLILGRDPEIGVMRPARLARVIANFAGLVETPTQMWLMALHSTGRLTTDEATFVAPSERSKVYRTSRIWLAIYAATVAACVVFDSVLPVLLIGGPRIYGVFMEQVYGLTQHTGLGENVLDHRLNTRTVKMCVVNRFLYWNMNYHVEHHMFPMVPYHRLPELSTEIQHDLAPVYPSIWAAWKELFPTMIRQLKDQSHYVHRELPPGAAPFHPKSDGRAV